MGRISTHQMKVFAMFSVAFVSAGFSSAYAHLHQNGLALMMGLLSLAAIVTVWTEAYRSE